jgi:hypothetical protein
MDLFLKVAPQCCDAGSYIGYGNECAAGQCYGDLRPMGDYYWFAIPQNMGWPLESLITAHFVLMTLSVLLSVMALSRILAPSVGAIDRKRKFLILLLSAVIHLVFLWPTIFNTLSDPPANLFLLNGIWLLIHACFRPGYRPLVSLQYSIAGICFGFAVWLRAFYLYPVILGLGIYFLLWVFSGKRKLSELLLLLALLPVGMQYFTMHKIYGTYSYLGEETTRIWRAVHLYQPFVGYDTVFPRNDFIWKPQNCKATLGIMGALEVGNYQQMVCILSERLYFYLGTYEPVTYIFSDRTNKLVHYSVESIGAPGSDWYVNGLDFEANVAIAPNGEKTADKLTFSAVEPGGKGDAMMWVGLQGNTPHTFSVWLWSPKEKTINLAFKTRDGDVQLERQQFMLTPVPTRYSITGTTLDAAEYTGMYDVDIGRTPYEDAAMSFGTEAGDFFYAWGAQLETGTKMTNYDPSGVSSPESIRTWRPALLLLNLGMLVMVAIAIIRCRLFWLQQRAGLAILTIMFASAAQGLAIIPEQRFAIGMMIFFWLIAATYISARVKKPFNKAAL